MGSKGCDRAAQCMAYATQEAEKRRSFEMVRVGIAGVGFMGWIHYLALRRLPAARLQAVATRDPVKRSGDWRSIRGNFGPPGEVVDLSSVRTYPSVQGLV